MIVYKYIEKQYLDDFKKKGTVCLHPLYYYKVTDNISIQDKEEGFSKLSIDPDKAPIELTSERASRAFSPSLFKNSFVVMPKAHVVRENDLPSNNALIFCTSVSLEQEIMDRFHCNAYYKIVEPYKFARTVFKELKKQDLSIHDYTMQKVKYVDKETCLTTPKQSDRIDELPNSLFEEYFRKSKLHNWQKELRMVFLSNHIIPNEAFIHSKELLRYCRF